MPQIVQAGSINTAALTVPDLYVQIVPPSAVTLNGVPSNVLGIVGSATWGPLNTPVLIGSIAQLVRSFGSPVVRKYDAGTHVCTATLQGANNFVLVRVSDGTALAATGVLEGLNLSGLYPGSAGLSITASLTVPGAKGAGFADLVVSNPAIGAGPELFSGIPITGTPSVDWPNIAAAVNTGALVGWINARGPSSLIVASSNGSTAAVTSGTSTLAGGTDGATGVTATTLIGIDGTARTGMYALRAQGVSIGLLADCDTVSTWTTQVAFGLSEGVYMVVTGPSGDTISNAVTQKQAAGVDSYAIKVMFGDWIMFSDGFNPGNRLVSPQGFAAGELANLSPEQSSLNKQLLGIVSSQRSGSTLAATGGAAAGTYASIELQTLIGAGIDVICNPAPGGAYWACRSGHNSSSNSAIFSDSYTRLTNYISQTLAAGLGLYVGQTINSTLFGNARATLLGYLGTLLQQGILGTTTGAIPYSVQCDASINPQARTSIGYVQANVLVMYQGINEKFIVNLQGGATVAIPQGQATGLNGTTAT